MKKNAKVIYSVEIIIALYVLWLNLNVNSATLITKNISSAVIFTTILFVLLAFFGIKRDKNISVGT